jgi:hypothetical protein
MAKGGPDPFGRDSPRATCIVARFGLCTISTSFGRGVFTACADHEREMSGELQFVHFGKWR